MSKRFTAFLIILLVFTAGLIVYRVFLNKKKARENIAGKQRVEAEIYGIIVSGAPFSDFLSLSGSIEPNEVVSLRSEISGIIEEINFTEGGHVVKDQVLIKINDAELRAQLVQAKTRHSLASENERRAKLLLEKEAISQEEYEIASADHRTAEAQIQLIEAQLIKTVIRAPFAGTVGLRNISRGSYITPTTDIAQLVDVSKVKLEFAVPEKNAAKVEIGTVVKFTIQGRNEQFAAKVYAIEPLVETATRTLRVRALADNSSSHFIPGTFASVIFPLGTLEDGLLVPAEALIPVQNGKKLFVKRRGAAREIFVETGARTDSDVLIVDGISEGDTVLTSGVMSLRDGSPVNVTLR